MYHTKTYLSIFMGMFLLQGCLKNNEVSNPDEAKIAENEQQIQQYIATNNLQMKTTNSGLYYKITEEKPAGSYPKKGEQVVVSYIGKLLNGTIIDSAVVKKDRYLRFPWNVYAYNMSLTPGIDEAVGLMREGERATIIMPFYLGLGRVAYDNIPAYSVLVFDLKLEDIQTQDEALQDYAQRKKLPDVQKTASNMYYSFLQKSTSTEPPSPTAQQFSLRYKGRFLDGVVFDSTRTTAPTEFDLTRVNLIAGFKEGIRLMRAGEKAIFLLPSAVAYGDQDLPNRTIPPFVPLVFEVEMVSVK